jgi:hypothetical protein
MPDTIQGVIEERSVTNGRRTYSDWGQSAASRIQDRVGIYGFTAGVSDDARASSLDFHRRSDPADLLVRYEARGCSKYASRLRHQHRCADPRHSGGSRLYANPPARDPLRALGVHFGEAGWVSPDYR